MFYNRVPDGESPTKNNSPSKKKMSVFIQGERSSVSGSIGGGKGKLQKTRTSREITAGPDPKSKRRMTHKKKIHDDIEEELNVVAEDPNELLRDIKGFIKKVNVNLYLHYRF